MSLSSFSTVISIALVFKKIARKGSLAKKKLRSRKGKPHDDTSVSTCSTDEKVDPISTMVKQTLQDVNHDSSKKHITSNQSHLATKRNDSSPAIKEAGHCPAMLEENKVSQEVRLDCTHAIQSGPEDETTGGELESTRLSPQIIIRDFAYPTSSPQHFGESPTITSPSVVSLSCSEFNGQHARVLYDFVPETEYEIALKAGDFIWVQYRQCPGWLIADVCDETGLIPESYVELV